MSDEFGLLEAVSIALGGMIGGGIYAVLGVVAQITGPAMWFAFVLASVVAAGAGYSYNVLNELGDDRGGSVTLVQCYTGNTTLAGVIGWTLLFGYVGSMAMYAFAFGEFAVGFPAVPDGYAGVDLRPIVSVLVVAAVVGLNLLGARATGVTENLLVVGKLLVLVAFGVGGVVYAFVGLTDPVRLGTSELTSFGPVTAAAIAFVAFQGWQLLFYNQEEIENPETTVPRAVYVAIPVAVAVYVLVAVATYNVAPGALEDHPHVALATAAETVLGSVGYPRLGFVAISLSALLSTGSAINATLFSTGYFAKGMVANDVLPDRVGDASTSGVPTGTLLALGAITAAFTVAGSLEAITAFASLAFIVVFGGMSSLAFRQRATDAVNPVVPAVSVLGCAAFFVLMFLHLYRAERQTFYAVVLLAVVVVGVELLYFERDVIEEEISPFDDEVDGTGDDDG